MLSEDLSIRLYGAATFLLDHILISEGVDITDATLEYIIELLRQVRHELKLEAEE